jgi:D-aspartate ligase
MKETLQKPKVLVLSRAGTGLATIRGLADGGAQITAAIFKKSEPLRYSFCCDVIDLSQVSTDQELMDWLISYGQQQVEPLVLIPSSDEHALLLAKNREQLKSYYLLWQNDHHTLTQIINKNRLYLLAEKAGVPVIPAINEPSLEEVTTWAASNPAPYFIKPFYEGNRECKLTRKNLVLASVNELIDYVKNNSAQALIIQRLIQGGDGYIFDTYGLCDEKGELITIASHRRWRQYPPDRGTTSFGEIPGTQDSAAEALMFEQTQRLLSSIKYHGIFGIEWLLDKNTGVYYVIDFNARPFTSVGHLHSCGLNLPLLAYQDLVGENLSHVEIEPQLRHKYWIDLLLDLWSLQDKLDARTISIRAWLKTVLRCRSSAYCSWKDPGPGFYRSLIIIKLLIDKVWKNVAK